MLAKKTKNNLIIFKNLILLLIAFSLILVIYYYRGINFSYNVDQEYNFEIKSGESLGSIIDNLEDVGLIKSKIIFKLHALLSGKQSSFRSGIYVLNSKMNVKEISEILTEKIFLKQEKKLTFIEGWNLRDYAKLLEENSLISQDNFFLLSGEALDSHNNSFLEFSFLSENSNLEGYLFPDTYRFFVDERAEDIIRKMLSNFDRKLNSQMRTDIASQGKSIHEIITMASIIEKEVRSDKDMKMVSGIFWNRIKNGQALESCASLAYILGVNKSQYSYEDTRINSPYNTYINRGLPPGPIANPGLKAIEAAIYPEPSNYNYFLTSSETGETIFSRTYEEHLSNKYKYIK